jgi:CheY-like chemotaxis protein
MHSKGIGFGCIFTIELPLTTSFTTSNEYIQLNIESLVNKSPKYDNRKNSIESIPPSMIYPIMDSNSNLYNNNNNNNNNNVKKNNNINIDSIKNDDNNNNNINNNDNISNINSINNNNNNNNINNDNNDNNNKLRVLVVDDVEMNRKMIIRCIKYKYAMIGEAEDGNIAVQAVQNAVENREPYDIILMDYQMPNMIGPIAAKIMRNNGYKGLIIGVTGNGLQPDVDYFLSHGANRVLIKPVSIEQINQCIHGKYTIYNTIYILYI